MPDPAEQLTLEGFKLRYIRLWRRFKALFLFLLAVALLFGAVGVILPMIGHPVASAKTLKSSTQSSNIAHALAMYQSGTPMLWGSTDQIRAALLDIGLVPPETFTSPRGEPGQTRYHIMPTDPLESGEIPVAYEYPPIDGGGVITYANNHTVFETEPRYSEILNNLTLPDGRPYRPHLGDKLPDPPPGLDVIDLREVE